MVFFLSQNVYTFTLSNRVVLNKLGCKISYWFFFLSLQPLFPCSNTPDQLHNSITNYNNLLQTLSWFIFQCRWSQGPYWFCQKQTAVGPRYSPCASWCCTAGPLTQWISATWQWKKENMGKLWVEQPKFPLGGRSNKSVLNAFNITSWISNSWFLNPSHSSAHGCTSGVPQSSRLSPHFLQVSAGAAPD